MLSVFDEFQYKIEFMLYALRQIMYAAEAELPIAFTIGEITNEEKYITIC